MRWVIFVLCVFLTVCAEDKKPQRPRQVQPHFVGAGRPKDQMTKKKSRIDTKKWFLSKTSLKKHGKKKIVRKKQEKGRKNGLFIKKLADKGGFESPFLFQSNRAEISSSITITN